MWYGTLQTGETIDSRAHNPRSFFEAPAFDYTSLAGRSADAVLLTVEKYESRLPLVSRAQERIATLAPDAFGVVVLNASRDECLQ